MRNVFIILLLFIGLASYAACTFDVLRNECNLEIYCNGELDYSFNIKDLVWTESPTGVNLNDGISSISMNINKINNFATTTELFDSLGVWKTDCSITGSIAECPLVLNQQGGAVYSAVSKTLLSDTYYSISILVSSGTVDITEEDIIDGGPAITETYSAGYTLNYTANGCNYLANEIVVDATNGEAVIKLIK